MKKIVISANTSWYIYNFRKNTILKFLFLNYKVYVLAPEDRYSRLLEDLGAVFIAVDIDQRGVNPIRDIFTTLKFYRLYKNIKPHVVLNFTPKNNIFGGFAAALLSIPTINNIAGLGSVFIERSILGLIVKYLYKISQSKASYIFFQNEEDRELFRKFQIGKSSKICRIKGSGVDLERFSISHSPDDGITKFILVARMLKEKGVYHFADAARAMRAKYTTAVEFYLLGFLESNTESAVTEQDLKDWENEGFLTYLGTSDDVSKQLQSMDCVVLPSYYREGVPKSLLEAGAMGKPIITTDNVGCNETVDDGINGFLCATNSSASLIRALDKFINLNYEERLIMGKNSRIKVEKEFDENIVISKYVDAVTNSIVP